MTTKPSNIANYRCFLFLIHDSARHCFNTSFFSWFYTLRRPYLGKIKQLSILHKKESSPETVNGITKHTYLPLFPRSLDFKTEVLYTRMCLCNFYVM